MVALVRSARRSRIPTTIRHPSPFRRPDFSFDDILKLTGLKFDRPVPQFPEAGIAGTSPAHNRAEKRFLNQQCKTHLLIIVIGINKATVNYYTIVNQLYILNILK